MQTKSAHSVNGLLWPADLNEVPLLRAEGEVVDAEQQAQRVARVQRQRQLGHLQGRRVQATPAQALRRAGGCRSDIC